MAEPERSPEEIMEDVNNLIAWYKALSEEFRNHVIFRWEKMRDPNCETLYVVMKAAQKLYSQERATMKKAKKKENHGQRPESV